MNRRTPSADLLNRYQLNLCTPEERKWVDDWYAGLNLETDEVFTEENQEDLFKKIDFRIKASEETTWIPQKRPGTLWLYASGIAASLLLTLGFLYYQTKSGTTGAMPQEAMVVFTNQKKQIIRYELPDKSILWITPGSKVQHPATFENKPTRHVLFTGEAFFEVTKNPKKPFEIHSGNLKTVVLGTSFNIRAHPKDQHYQVSVVTGQVAVSAANHTDNSKALLLKPQQQATFVPATSALTRDNLRAKKYENDPWQPVSLTFDDTRLDEIVKRLQQTFKVNIALANPVMKNCILKVDFNQQNLPEILEIINTLLGSTYEINDDNIILSGEGCLDQ